MVSFLRPTAASDLQRAVDHMLSDINANKAYGTAAPDVDAMSATQRRKAEIEAQTKILQAQRELELVCVCVCVCDSVCVCACVFVRV